MLVGNHVVLILRIHRLILRQDVDFFDGEKRRDNGACGCGDGDGGRVVRMVLMMMMMMMMVLLLLLVVLLLVMLMLLLLLLLLVSGGRGRRRGSSGGGGGEVRVQRRVGASEVFEKVGETRLVHVDVAG